jgi:tetraacyldisaccharide 4'-kinase
VEFDIPVISIGNITIGGTGKTPFVEYLVELLHKRFKLGVLSRGYKRKTTGFLLANKATVLEDIGDESFQIFRKYPDIDVAVDEKRVNGIREMRKHNKDLQVILLDDAFQHRYIMPGVSILLIDYYRPVFKDFLLPYGELREHREAIRRANIVIITKVPGSIKPIEKRLWKKELKLFPYQYLYFTTYSYGELTPLIKGTGKKISLTEMKKKSSSVLVVTGIANPKPLVNYLQGFSGKVSALRFPDHHAYTQKDYQLIRKRYEMIPTTNKIIVTTEKDAVKMIRVDSLDQGVMERMYYLPVKVKFLDDRECDFDSNILNYVGEDKEINRLYK